MLYLVAILSPPLALLFAKKWGQFFVSCLIMLFAAIGLFFMLIPGIVLWLVAIVHAILVIHGKKADARTQKVVDAIDAQKGAP
jgi:hypothetical protein